MEIRLLTSGDEDALEGFLAPRAESSMFLRANVRRAGLVDRGEALQGTYVAAFEGPAIVAVAAHVWNGMVLVQAPRWTAEVVRAAVSRTDRPVAGLSGPHDQVLAARGALGLEDAATTLHGKEKLYTLALADLRSPAALVDGRVRCRAPRASELELLSDWRVAYDAEALGAEMSSARAAEARATMKRIVEGGDAWVLTAEDDTPRAFSAFNARLPDIVQIGGVFTPPPDRGKGLARAVVAGSLLEARAGGVERALLFTAETNLAAQRAYTALGFREIGFYGLLLLRDPTRGSVRGSAREPL